MPSDRTARTTSVTLCFGLLIAISAGCGGDERVEGREETVPVRGVVTLDGEPLGDAIVLFHPVGGNRTARGRTDAEGRFELTTFEDADGAVVGDYQVTVKRVDTTATPDPRGEAFPPKVEETWVTPKRYAEPTASPLEISIGGAGETELELRVES